jgi:hypothetical protein
MTVRYLRHVPPCAITCHHLPPPAHHLLPNFTTRHHVQVSLGIVFLIAGTFVFIGCMQARRAAKGDKSPILGNYIVGKEYNT